MSIKVYFSHQGEDCLKNLEKQSETYHVTKVDELLDKIESKHVGFKATILDENGNFKSSVMIFKNFEIYENNSAFYTTDDTKEIKSTSESLDNVENILISILNPEKIMDFFDKTLTDTEIKLEYTNKDGGLSKTGYQAFINGRTDNNGDSLELNGEELFQGPFLEPLYPFNNGEEVSNLLTDGKINIKFKQDSEELFDRKKSKVIPRPILDGIKKVWGIDENNLRLRLFQEDCLFNILGNLYNKEKVENESLLLSIPTGGGKTEAFLVPTISHIYNVKKHYNKFGEKDQSVKSIIVYPTRALANDQAKRISEILYHVNNSNQDVDYTTKVTMSILTGDTPNSGYSSDQLRDNAIIQICPNCGSSTKFKKIKKNGSEKWIMRCKCGSEIDYFIHTRKNILDFVPDILITSPDMINQLLQLPAYKNRLFTKNLDLVIFDEVHMYESIFGCNVAHVLRRLEEAIGKKPFYVGVSATIGNAKELASLIFNTPYEDVLYLRNSQDEEYDKEKRFYIDTSQEPTRTRYHYVVSPYQINEKRWRKATTATLNMADVLGHIVKDPHFRKTIIFSNYRQDTDDVIRFLRDQEDRFFKPYRDEIRRYLQTGQSMYRPSAKVAASVSRWFDKADNLGILHSDSLELGWHRGGLEKEERIKAVNKFSSTKRIQFDDVDTFEKPIDLLSATKTLELGIDIGNVTSVINNSAPFTTNEYAQRVGRGGRKKDSLAITVINPRSVLDFYFLKNFENKFVHPSNDDFEEAPIIISNKYVMKSHMLARILDFFADLIDDYKFEIKVSDLREINILYENQNINIVQNPTSFGKAIYEKLFTEEDTDRFINWLASEEVMDSKKIKIQGSDLKKWIIEECKELSTKIKSNEFMDRHVLTGMRSVRRELVPNLRSSGETVELKVIKERGEDKTEDRIPLNQAVSNYPPGAYASQGSVTFKIKQISDRHQTKNVEIRRAFTKSQDMLDYFKEQFADEEGNSYLPDDSLDFALNADFIVPKELSVKYDPYRFYCPGCGRTYTHKEVIPGREICSKCHTELRQLTELFMCEKCGDLFIPPVPKVCVNPNCVENATDDKGRKFIDVYKSNNYVKFDKFFSFTALPKQNWKCNNCNTVFNYYHSYGPQGKNWGKEGLNDATDIALKFYNTTEAKLNYNYYLNKGYNLARYNCPKCKKEDNTKRSIRVVNPPLVRSQLNEFIIKEEKQIVDGIKNDYIELDFDNIRVISLAKETSRLFFNKHTESVGVSKDKIYKDPDKKFNFLANLSESHGLFIKLSQDYLNDFFSQNKFVSKCRHEDCTECKLLIQDSKRKEESKELDDYDDNSGGEKPLVGLLDHEVNKKPDPRKKWCEVAGTHADCNDLTCINCDKFVEEDYYKYLIVHTFKHALIVAMTKYAGINKNQVRGKLKPNDNIDNDYDLVIVDTLEGGSGSYYLVKRNWDKIWDLTYHLIENAAEDMGELYLPYTCSRYNYDLCPLITLEFLQFIRGR